MSSGAHMTARRALREIRDFELVAEALGVDVLVAWERVRVLDGQLPHLSNAELFVLALAEFARWRAEGR